MKECCFIFKWQKYLKMFLFILERNTFLLYFVEFLISISLFDWKIVFFFVRISGWAWRWRRVGGSEEDQAPRVPAAVTGRQCCPSVSSVRARGCPLCARGAGTSEWDFPPETGASLKEWEPRRQTTFAPSSWSCSRRACARAAPWGAQGSAPGGVIFSGLDGRQTGQQASNDPSNALSK